MRDSSWHNPIKPNSSPLTLSQEGLDPPQVIFLDAVGTLFGVRGSVGEVYRDFTRQQTGIELDAEATNTAFYEAFDAAPPAEFPELITQKKPGSFLLEQEFNWWLAIAQDTFSRLGVLVQFPDFQNFFEHLFAYFATADPWIIYPDVRPTLRHWRQQGIELGIVSNFDSRLYTVVDSLDLAQFFTSVTISTRVGAAKPNPQVWYSALAAHNCPPEAAWHIGDSYREDVEGAIAAGLRGIWLNRP